MARYRYFVASALTEDFAYTTFVRATGKLDAEKQLREEKRFRRACRQNGVNFRTVDVITEESSAARGAEATAF
jgi:hypothetical protein